MATWLLTGVSLVVAGIAFMKARRVARRLERLSESYWELRYEHGQLASRLARLERPPNSAGEPADAHDQNGRNVAFVPLSSLKRSGQG